MNGLFQSYTNVPKTVEAVQFTDKYKDRILHQLSGSVGVDVKDGLPVLLITTIHGDTTVVRLGDWIIKEPKSGYYYPVQDEVFHNSYVCEDPNGGSR